MKKRLILTTFLIFFLFGFLAFSFPVHVSASYSTIHNGSVYDLSSVNEQSYERYLANLSASFAGVEVLIDPTTSFVQSNTFNSDVASVVNQEGIIGLLIPETVGVTWTFEIAVSGLYHIKLRYLTVEGRSAEITKGILINGQTPFKEAQSVSFTRVWEDSFGVEVYRQDGKHDIKPTQVEKIRWNEVTIRDRAGYYNGQSYAFYFEAGINTFTLTPDKEPMILSAITLFEEPRVQTYQEVHDQHINQGAVKVDTSSFFQEGFVKVQGERSYEKSSPILAPTANWSSYKVDPYEAFIMRYNTIGGIAWRVPGDWISWEVYAPASGLYQLTFKVSQNFSRGMNATRRLTINGQLPFEEASNITFPYQSDWQNVTLGNSDGAYWFYLEEGVNVITLEATIGLYNDIVKKTEEAISILNTMYRRIVMIAGTNPDQYQDYLLYERISNLSLMISQSTELIISAMNDIEQVAGQRGSLLASFEKTLYQLRQFVKSEKNIQIGLKELGDNISALGTWVMQISQQPLAVDAFYLHGNNTSLPKAHTNFFQKLWHELVMLFGSYGANTSLQSNVEVDGPTITVWMMSGRDQSQLLRQLIDEQFTVQKNINVNLKLVAGEALLPATLSGNGPDVAIGVGQNLPVNWGIRNALVDVSKFNDFNEVASWFHPSAITPFEFRNSVYALPDTQDFLVTFVRTDIIDELNLQVPVSWDEVTAMVPALQRQYLDFYLPNSKGALSTLLYAMIVQNGGQLYDEDGKSTLLLERHAQAAFIDFTTFFSDFGFEISANFANRFRSGEMPIGVFNYTLYNTLSVFAPEIRGQWEFSSLPGYEIDGVIHNQTTSISSGSVILASSKEQQASWEFLKWWTGHEAQSSYARGMEAILGAAARYPTANLQAFSSLPWSAKDYVMLTSQRDNAVGIPTVPGDYIIGRHIDNAFRSTINDKTNPRENLFEYVEKINLELARKRQEFNLD